MLLASDKLVYFMQMITRKTVRASLNLADQSLVKSIIREYPSLQCRLDTLKSGTVCDVPMTDRLSNSDSSAGVCGEGIGKRPRCWFKPGTP